MKPPSVFDPEFKYVPANRTDVRETFERIRRRMRERLDAECATCNGDPNICASVPGLRHCEKANRE